MNRRKLYILATLLASVLTVSGFLMGGQSTTQASSQVTMPATSVNAGAPQQQPKGDEPDVIKEIPAYLKADHGKYDNRQSALYEAWLNGENIKDWNGGGSNDASNSSGPNGVFSPLYGPDVRMSNAAFAGSQNEFQLDINPTNHLNIIGASNDGRTAGVGIYRSTDGGLTWTAQDASVYGVPAACCDPAVAFAYDGTVYVGILDTSPAGQYTLRSTDGGATFTNLGLLALPDRNNIVVDNGPTSPRRGAVYVTYFDGSRIRGYRSDNQGATWVGPFPVGGPPPAAGYRQSSQPRVASDGTLYVGFQEYLNSSQGCAAGVNNVVAKSTDGGATFTETIIPIIQGGACTPAQVGRGIFCINASGSSFRSRSHPIMGVHPTNPNEVYMFYSGGDLETSYTCGTSTGRHGDALFRRSTDGGATFSAPLRINTDPTGWDQYYGWIDVAPNGTIWAGWQDRRDDPNNFRHHWYQAFSIDGGLTWQGETRVSDVSSQPATFIGDYNGLAAEDDLVLGMWWDSRNTASGDPYTDPNVPVQGTPTPTVTGTPPTATRTATAPTATRTNTAATATATACTAGAVLTGSLDASDPDFTRPNTFQQGGTCTTNGVHNYDVYTLQTIGGQVTASTCGGASWDTYLIIYQAPGGVPVPGFTPSGCTMAIAANDDACGLQSTVTANLVAGTYYVVVSEFSTPGGGYIVTVTAPGACVTGTPAATGTATTTGVTTSTATRTNTALISSTATVAASSTATTQATGTATTPANTATSTVAPPTRTATSTPTTCPIMFSDVQPGDEFYPFIRCLACRGIISGYSDGTFRPFNDITRGQISKMVSNSAGFTENPDPQIYEDVAPSNPFYTWINRLSRRGYMTGYNCGDPAEPCIGPGSRPYFRPFNNATRGQLSKIVSNAAGFNETVPPTQQTYTDVPPNSTFWAFIERLTSRGVMGGYPCGSAGEPCDAQNRPYFRPNANVTRGQASKIVANTFFPNCVTPYVMFGLTTSNKLVRFNSNTPGTFLRSMNITGMQSGETMLGIDYRPANGQMYALGSSSRLYTLNTMTGEASVVTSTTFITPLVGTDFGFDFNPTVDRIRVVSDADQNLRLNPATGTVAAQDGTLTYAANDPNFGQDPNVTGAGYTNSFQGSTTTTLYDIDTNLDILVTQNPPNNGTLNTVGPFGFSVTGDAGFDIEAFSNTAYASLVTTGETRSKLYNINLGTGAATLIGTISGTGMAGDTLRGLALAPDGTP